MAENEAMYSVSAVAKKLGVSPQTVRRWLKTGAVRGVQVTKSGNWRIKESELERIWREKP